MRLEIRDKEPEKKEPVATLWLERESDDQISLYYQVDGKVPDTLAQFNEEEKEFHVFDDDVMKLGYKVTSTKHPG